MKTAVTLEAAARENAGKGAARALRRQDMIPAVLYSKGKEAMKLSVPAKELMLQYRKGGFFNTVVTLKFGKESFDAIPREIQLHPVTDKPEHADFLQVTKDSKVRVMVPVHFLNADKAVGIKRGGVLNIVRHEIEFICLPSAIPEYIEVDIADADIGDSIHINDVKLPADITPAIRDRNFTIATVAGRQAEEEEVKPATAATTVEGGAAGDATVAGGAAATPAADAKAPAKDDKKK